LNINKKKITKQRLQEIDKDLENCYRKDNKERKFLHDERNMCNNLSTFFVLKEYIKDPW